MRNYAKELDVYSGIAIIFVVLIHANAYYLTKVLNFETYQESGYFLTFVDQIVHIAVPMFIFIAGFKYALKENQTKYSRFLKKRLSKIMLPFLVLSLIFILTNNLRKISIVDIESVWLFVFNMVFDFVKIFMGYNFAYQLWYIPMYLLVVLSYPLVCKIIKTQKTRLLFFCLLSLTYVSFESFTSIFDEYSKPFSFVYYFMFFEIGCYAAKSKFTKKQKYLLLLVYMIVLITSITTSTTLFDSLITDIILTPISVLLFYYVSLKLKDSYTLSKLGEYSFYIFLFHEPVFLTLLSKIFHNVNLYKGYHIPLIVTALTIILSVITYKTLEKTGVLKVLFFEKPKTITQKTS